MEWLCAEPLSYNGARRKGNVMDIAEKLRTYDRERSGYAEYCHRAADEIDRLRDELSKAKSDNDRLRKELFGLVAEVNRLDA